jgi:hypothetical protein
LARLNATALLASRDRFAPGVSHRTAADGELQPDRARIEDEKLETGADEVGED